MDMIFTFFIIMWQQKKIREMQNETEDLENKLTEKSSNWMVPVTEGQITECLL